MRKCLQNFENKLFHDPRKQGLVFVQKTLFHILYKILTKINLKFYVSLTKIHIEFSFIHEIFCLQTSQSFMSVKAIVLNKSKLYFSVVKQKKQLQYLFY